ncbi:bifunctional 23S rRNA (guanine(2069)-N(7))-methyltransferase RlmK/23S rRNA (guanine(2445)-N(2))-methyltransferase RlmL [Parasphaerochaeta coccoides]|uniref:Ribosomal RNA large subunit methyltransferase K/L n=1 Tax=Parasphaerochaeta coccoides (strain ATCC BAA-1237 / DSM 17374 / SPN1) TaxID=760011 RepID=F4GHH6_PARC1|nr:bifunctional 23S rRNA (guanine(2069)-N(7))-methyltransferase RlmK/23S rRNA (guanine(2445)-N(2))-methyltransferase RlmL [Parasphaerochaeta coccoides]AEC02565.1 Ribosomal RNA large subunit methyltransferase L [Parasphaerochaeta coccoides DSM 17374]
MFFYATASAHQGDIVEDEVMQAGAAHTRSMGGGIEFEADLETAYRFCLWSRVSTRLMVALYKDDDIQSSDELYESSLQIPWEDWVNPEKTFSITESMTTCSWLKNSHFGTLRLKDAIADRIRERFDDQRPSVDLENPDVTFHMHIDVNTVTWYVDFSGKSLHKRGYRTQQTEAVLREHLASSILWRSEWRRSITDAGAGVLLDPFCGAGTLVVEAALMATDTAPGLVDPSRFAFLKLPLHQPQTWEKVLSEALSRQKAGRSRSIEIHAWDIDPQAIEAAKGNAQAAGVSDFITFAVKDFTSMSVEDVPAAHGYVVTDPPYGVRLADPEIITLYRKIGGTLNALFGGWRVSILCGEQELLSYVDLKPERTNSIYNGGILCQLAHYVVFSEEERKELAARAEQRRKERLEAPLSEGSQMAFNRLKKNLATLTPLMMKQGVSCYRIYDADMPEYSAAIDLYENRYISLQEYAAPDSIDPEAAERRLEELVLATERATGIPYEKIFVKRRERQKGLAQYEKMDDAKNFYVVTEHSLRFLVNFNSYLDTGIFLDHRPVRRVIKENAKDTRFLNLFCYTGTATVHAAAGGALSTVSVDTSATYLDWAAKNMELNAFYGMNHFRYKDDVMEWLRNSNTGEFDLIFCDPPTYSNSKDRRSFDIQRDHISLVDACMNHLTPGGTLIFSNNFRKFKLDEILMEDYDVEDVSSKTIGDDFARDPRIHNTFLIHHKDGKKPRLTSASFTGDGTKPRKIVIKKKIITTG